MSQTAALKSREKMFHLKEDISEHLIDLITYECLVIHNIHIFTLYSITLILTHVTQTSSNDHQTNSSSFSFKVWGGEMKHERQAGKSARQRRNLCNTHINTALMQSHVTVQLLCWETWALTPRGFTILHIRTRWSKMHERQDKVFNNSEENSFYTAGM